MAYNGWTNYETWLVALWAGNEQGSSRHLDYMAQDAYDNATADRTFTRLDRATLDLADALRDWMDEQNPLTDEASVWSDLISAALSEVDWHEWAEDLMSDVTQETGEPEPDAETEPAE